MTSRKKPIEVAKTLVAYEGAALEDAELRVLGPATIDVVASVLAGHPVEGGLIGLRPDVVAVDEEAGPAAVRLSLNSVRAEGSGLIALAFWLEDAVIIVKCRRLVMDAIVDSWIDRVRTTAVTHEATSKGTENPRSEADDSGRKFAG